MRGEWLTVCLIGLVLLGGCEDKAPAPPRPKRIVDLSPQLTPDTLVRQYGHRACEFFGLQERSEPMPVRPENGMRTFGFTSFQILSHAGAHVDAAARLLRDGNRPAEIPLDKLYGWARVVDLRWHDRTAPITITDLESYKLRPNEIVVLDVGYSGPTNDDWPQYAYLSEAAAQWLSDIGIRAIATDMPSLGSLSMAADRMEKGRPPEEIWPAHVPFFQKDIPVIEGLVNLDQLIGEPRPYFAGFPLPLADRSGAPMRAVAFLYEY